MTAAATMAVRLARDFFNGLLGVPRQYSSHVVIVVMLVVMIVMNVMMMIVMMVMVLLGERRERREAKRGAKY